MLHFYQYTFHPFVAPKAAGTQNMSLQPHSSGLGPPSIGSGSRQIGISMNMYLPGIYPVYGTNLYMLEIC